MIYVVDYALVFIECQIFVVYVPIAMCETLGSRIQISKPFCRGYTHEKAFVNRSQNAEEGCLDESEPRETKPLVIAIYRAEEQLLCYKNVSET